MFHRKNPPNQEGRAEGQKREQSELQKKNLDASETQSRRFKIVFLQGANNDFLSVVILHPLIGGFMLS